MGVFLLLDNKKIAAFIAQKRRQKGLTQQQVAQALHVSFQAVSKWETGTAYPAIELLYDLSRLLGVTTDEILKAQDSEQTGLTYSKAGVDISYTDAIKQELSDYVRTEHPRLLNGIGAFASLYDIRFDDILHPVLLLKAEEPGSKQKLAMQYGYTDTICHDMINHLVNDIIVMGAKPLAVLDTIICGNAEKDTITMLVKSMADACRANDCHLVGGETSVQPSVVDKGVYILTSSIAGIADRDAIIDGSRIQSGDKLLAVASNGLHTNGYSLVRLLMEELPHIRQEKLGNETFLEAVMKPHTPYYKAVRDLFGNPGLHGMAHITGGGIAGNLCRIMPRGLCADIDLSRIRTLPLFRFLKANGNIADSEMLQTFNCGVGLILAVHPDASAEIQRHVCTHYDCYEIGTVAACTQDSTPVVFHGDLCWQD